MYYYYQLFRFHYINQMYLKNRRMLNKNMNRLLTERRKLRHYISLKK